MPLKVHTCHQRLLKSPHPTPTTTCGSALTGEATDTQFCKKQLLKIKFNSWHVLQHFLCSKLNTEATHATTDLAKYSTEGSLLLGGPGEQCATARAADSVGRLRRAL